MSELILCYSDHIYGYTDRHYALTVGSMYGWQGYVKYGEHTTPNYFIKQYYI